MPEKEPDTASVSEPRCPKCRGEMDEGVLNSGGDHSLSYLSKNAPKGFFQNRNVTANRAKACYRCGYVELYLDPAALAKSISKP